MNVCICIIYIYIINIYIYIYIYICMSGFASCRRIQFVTFTRKGRICDSKGFLCISGTWNPICHVYDQTYNPRFQKVSVYFEARDSVLHLYEKRQSLRFQIIYVQLPGPGIIFHLYTNKSNLRFQRVSVHLRGPEPHSSYTKIKL